MAARLGARWQPIFDHPMLQLELRRIRRRRWWPGRRFFLFYPVVLGAALGCGVMAAVTDSLGVQAAALVTGLPGICLLGVVTGLLSFILPWIAPVLTATTIARERELGTLDLLRATLLTERGIVLGKLGGCLVQLWPGILTLALLTPFQLIGVAGSGLFVTSSYFPMLVIDPAFDTGRDWVWLVLAGVAGVAGMLRPWGDLALHAAVGMCASVRYRTSGAAIAASYGAIIMIRAGLWLLTTTLVPALMMLAFTNPVGQMEAAMEHGMLISGLIPLATVFAEIAGAVLLMWGAIWWLKQT